MKLLAERINNMNSDEYRAQFAVEIEISEQDKKLLIPGEEQHGYKLYRMYNHVVLEDNNRFYIKDI